MSGEVIPRASIDAIVAHRNRALELYASAWEAIAKADQAIRAAHSAVLDACGGVEPSRVHVEAHVSEVHAFRNAVALPDSAQFARVARRLTDIQVWASLIDRTALEHLMDKSAKDQLRAQMAYIPEKVDGRTGTVINADEIAKGLPDVTVDAVLQTIEGLVAESGTIFKRGIANAFSELDRRFRSHDGFKIGARVILSGAFDAFGHWNYYRKTRDTLLDIERVFLVLDGKGPRASYGGIVGKVEAERKGFRNGVTVHEGDYFRVRIFKNGNAHLWFTRPELVEQVNKLLADYYGEVLGEGVDRPQTRNRRGDPLADRKLAPARRFGFFPTPPKLVDRLLDPLRLYRGAGDPALRILEPSAGTGNIARQLAELSYGHVDVVEIQPALAAQLEASGLYARVYARDFLTMPAEPIYDVVVMNPPFDLQRDIDHVSHAFDFLKPGGELAAIMAAGAEWREDRKAVAFRALMAAHGARWEDVPAGAFADAGTNVNTVILRVRKVDLRFRTRATGD